MIIRIFAVSVLALIVGAYLEGARAGQFFVCDDGRTIEVEFDELEAAKRNEPCVARHFKSEGQRGRGPAQSAGKSPAPLRINTTAGPIELPVRKPPVAQLRKSHRETPLPRSMEARQLARAMVEGQLQVRIINARPGAPKWFQSE